MAQRGDRSLSKQGAQWKADCTPGMSRLQRMSYRIAFGFRSDICGGEELRPAPTTGMSVLRCTMTSRQRIELAHASRTHDERQFLLPAVP
jgi:hypothetical protein